MVLLILFLGSHDLPDLEVTASGVLPLQFGEIVGILFPSFLLSLEQGLHSSALADFRAFWLESHGHARGNAFWLYSDSKFHLGGVNLQNSPFFAGNKKLVRNVFPPSSSKKH